MPALAWKRVCAPTRPSATRDRHPALFSQMAASPALELFYPHRLPTPIPFSRRLDPVHRLDAQKAVPLRSDRESRVGHLSRIKRYMEEAEDRGWWYGPDKTVCDRHVEDGALAQLIAVGAEATACSYCDRTGSEPFAAPLDVLIDRIGTSLPMEA